MVTHMLTRVCGAMLEVVTKGLEKQQWTNDILDKTKGIFKIHLGPLISYGGLLYYLPNLGLKLPRSTRFVTNFLMIDQLIKIKDALEQIVIHLDWSIYVSKLNQGRDDQKRSANEAHQIKENVNNDNFWSSCNNYRPHVGKGIKSTESV